MRLSPKRCLFISLVFSLVRFAYPQGGLDQANPIAPFLNGALPSETPRPASGGWRLVNAFPQLTFWNPVQMLPVPYSNRLIVLEKNGRILTIDNDPDADEKTFLLDIRSQVESTEDSGMVGLAFHPDFGVPGSPNRHYLYIYYRFSPDPSETQKAYCRLSRFTWDPQTDSIAPSSEYVLINQFDRHNWHSGGGIFFGDDGFLYLSIGDEGGADDEFGSGQKIDGSLFGGVLRIDVDRDPLRSHPIRRQPADPAEPPTGWPSSYTQGYYIPDDNPWQSIEGNNLEEFFAIGLRSPHRMTFDSPSSRIWVGDVGQADREEVSVITPGANLQWPYREGDVDGSVARPGQLLGVEKPPVHSYGRDEGGCVIGGYVYRGSLHPELQGKYVFGDLVSGRIWSLEDTSTGPAVTQLGSLTRTGMTSFGIDAAGELYVLGLSGVIQRIDKATAGVPEPPLLLSNTGAFSDLASLTPVPGVIPYDVIQPLWSDGADKRRWIAIPNDGYPDTPGETIDWSEEGNWTFPNGTVLIKHFEFSGRRLETRFLVRGVDGEWFGFTYRWLEDGTDAELLPGAPLDVTFTLDGQNLNWHFPGRAECASCHTDATGKVIGVRTRHLNRNLFYEETGRTANQIVTFNRLGFFSQPLDESILETVLTAASLSDRSATLEKRARSYLDINCSHCHQPETATQASFDLRLQVPPWYQELINVDPSHSDLGIAGARLVSPGSVEKSILFHRTNSLEPGVAMPPLAKNVIDSAAIELLREWIESLDPTSSPSGALPGPIPSDHVPPAIILSMAGGGAVVPGSFEVLVEASESIAGLGVEDFVISNGTAESLSGGGSSWTLRVKTGCRWDRFPDSTLGPGDGPQWKRERGSADSSRL